MPGPQTATISANTDCAVSGAPRVFISGASSPSVDRGR